MACNLPVEFVPCRTLSLVRPLSCPGQRSPTTTEPRSTQEGRGNVVFNSSSPLLSTRNTAQRCNVLTDVPARASPGLPLWVARVGTLQEARAMSTEAIAVVAAVAFWFSAFVLLYLWRADSQHRTRRESEHEDVHNEQCPSSRATTPRRRCQGPS